MERRGRELLCAGQAGVAWNRCPTYLGVSSAPADAEPVHGGGSVNARGTLGRKTPHLHAGQRQPAAWTGVPEKPFRGRDIWLWLLEPTGQ